MWMKFMNTQQRRQRLMKTLAILVIFSLFAFQSFLIPSSNAVALQEAGPATICQGYGTGGPVSSGCYLNPWQFTSSLNQGRVFHAVVAFRNHIYAIGGQDLASSKNLDSVEYAAVNPDGTLGSWQIISHMNTTRWGFASAAANGHIYAIGGYGPTGEPVDSEQAKVNADGTLGPWQPVTSPTIRLVPAAIAVGNFLYVLGGAASGDGSQKSVERAMISPDGTLGPWQFMSSMNVERSNSAAVQVGNYIYIFGGTTGSVFLNSVERAAVNADGTLGPWQMLMPMLTIRYGLTAISAQGYIYALGGTNNVEYSDSVERAAILPDGTLADWQFVDSMNTERAWAGATIVNNRIYEVGGLNITDAAVGSTVEYVDVARIGVPPDFGVTINNGSLFTNHTAVTLTISARPKTYMIQVSNDGGFYGAQWEPCVLSKPWTIVQYGNFIIPRVVYVRFKDIYGVVSATYQDDIILDMAPPTGSISISPGPANMQLEQDLEQKATPMLGGTL
jgi:hypothetical protein